MDLYKINKIPLNKRFPPPLSKFGVGYFGIQKIRIPIPEKLWADKGLYFYKLLRVIKLLTSERLGEAFEGDFRDNAPENFCWCRWIASGESRVYRPQPFYSLKWLVERDVSGHYICLAVLSETHLGSTWTFLRPKSKTGMSRK